MEIEKAKEVWKPIKNYEGIYEVSNLGNVRSLDQSLPHKGRHRNIKGRILKAYLNMNGYFIVALCKDGYRKQKTVHSLVAEAFIHEIPDVKHLVVDHINNVKTDNRLENLQYISKRENNSKDRKGGSSKYVGVGWHSKQNKWYSRITVEGKRVHLGYFDNELEASKAYQRELNLLNQ